MYDMSADCCELQYPYDPPSPTEEDDYDTEARLWRKFPDVNTCRYCSQYYHVHSIRSIGCWDTVIVKWVNRLLS